MSYVQYVTMKCYCFILFHVSFMERSDRSMNHPCICFVLSLSGRTDEKRWHRTKCRLCGKKLLPCLPPYLAAPPPKRNSKGLPLTVCTMGGSFLVSCISAGVVFERCTQWHIVLFSVGNMLMRLYCLYNKSTEKCH